MLIQVKNIDVLTSLLKHKYDPNLILLIRYVANIAGIFITEGHRLQKHPNDLHGLAPVRAIDGRSGIYTKPQMLVNRINRRWIYDPDRPDMKCAVFGDKNHQDHIHFQVYPKTQFMKDGKAQPS